MIETLAQIKEIIERLAKQLNIDSELLPTFSSSADFGRPHIEVRESTYHYITVERGQEISHMSTNDLDKLLYWVFRDATSQMGYSYELAHRDPSQDFRKIAFAHTLELLDKLNPAWKIKREAELADTLEKYPFQDDLKI